MTAMAWVALVVIAAATGSLTALLVAAMGRESARIDAGLAELNRQVDVDRAQRHQVGQHMRRGGVGPCLLCGDKGPS